MSGDESSQQNVFVFVSYVWKADGDTWENLDAVVLLFDVYTDSASMLFFICTWLSAAHYRTLANRIDSFRTAIDVSTLQDDVVALQLRAWNEMHFLVYDSVQEFNRCFGPLLLANFTFLAVFSCTSLYDIWCTPLDEGWIMLVLNVFFFIDSFLMMSLLAYAADRIRHEVILRRRS